MNNIPQAYLHTPSELVVLLVRAGWSQEEIANETESTQATISRILHGMHKDPKYSLVVKLRNAVLKLEELVE
ncbi:MAG: helix-turn-helix protein [Glomeribacter sp. 1016415]|uniref:Bbp31 protein n=1 Tax=Mycoavidus cysteinexigens TaxID=1553431 RepID=A0A2Z6EWG6_9BURK|nr:helix-turn-helix domain-containing protein [Mycoavidus cysteinexigens]MCX8567042.1 helix-turn-helix protein [Glomeribacter sp. 1016415]BBE09807.1 Bbp31 protein [Mycoavidus cysteinexigens]GLR01708.1 hypothetical protein GCM10007934_15200 [Mycoavidus cysteinexigens]